MPYESIDSLWFYKELRDCAFLDDETVVATTAKADVWKIPLGNGLPERLFGSKEVLLPVTRALGKRDHETTEPAQGGYPRLAASGRGKMVVVNTHDLVLIACPLDREQPLDLFSNCWGIYYPPLAFSPDGSLFAAGQHLTLCDFGRTEVRVVEQFSKAGWHPDQRRLLACDHDGALSWLDFGRGLADAPITKLGVVATDTLSDPVVGVVVSPSGEKCLTAFERGATVGHLARWQLSPFQLDAACPCEDGAIYGMAAPPHCRWIALETATGVRLWDPATLTPLGDLIPGASSPRFSPSGLRLITIAEDASGNRRPTIWDVTDCRSQSATTQQGNSATPFHLTAFSRVPANVREIDGQALYQAACDAPHDDAPRLAYAEWLTQHGDPRGEFIRMQIQIALLSEEDYDRADLMRRSARIEGDNYYDWVGPFHKLQAFGCYFRRGLIEEVGMTAAKFAWNGDALSRLAPIRGARLEFRPLEGTASLAKSTSLERLTDLNLSRSGVGYHIDELAASPHLVRLRHLDLENNGLYRFAPAGSSCLANLTHLHLGGNSLTDDAIIAMVAAPGLPRLQELRLAYNRFTSAGVQALAESPFQTELFKLSLCGNPIDDAGIQALAESIHLPQLSVLDVSDTKMTGAGLTALLYSQNFELSELHLRQLQLNDNDLRLLVASPQAQRLKVLSLRGTHLSEVGAQLLAAAESLRGLKKLRLNKDDTTADAWRALTTRFESRLRNDSLFDWGAEGESCALYVNNDGTLPEGIAHERLRELGKVGWQENLRQPGACLTIERLVNQGYFVADCVRKFLDRFDGVSISGDLRVNGYRMTRRMSVSPDAAAGQTSPAELTDYEKRVGARLCPIGTGYDDQLLLMDEHERLFAIDQHGEMFNMGDSGIELFTGGMWPVTDDDHWENR